MSDDNMNPAVYNDIREGFTPQTSDLRGALPNPNFTIVSSIDNGATLDANTNGLTPPRIQTC